MWLICSSAAMQWILCILLWYILPAIIYLGRVNNRNTRRRCEICSKLTIKTSEQCLLVSLLLTLNIFHPFLFCRLGYFKLVLAPEPNIIMTWKLDQILKRSKRNTNTSKTCKSDAKMTKYDFMYDFPNFVKNWNPLRLQSSRTS